MIQVKPILTRLLLVASLMLPWATTGALETFERGGVISAVGYDQFTVNQQKYRVAPGAKLRSFDASRKKFSDFRPGDLIIFHGKVLNDVHYVDVIIYHPPIKS